MSLSDDQYEKDAATLRKAMEGWGTDEGPIIELTAKRTNADRQKIMKFYKTCYGRDCLKDLQDELSGDLKRCVIAMFKTPVDYDTELIHGAMKGMGTDEELLIEIICSSTPSHLEKIKKRFEELYKKTLESELEDELSGDLQRLMIAYIAGGKSDDTTVNKEKCDIDVKNLYEAGEGQWGTDESAFIKIFSLRSPAEIRYIDKAYAKYCGKSLYEVVSDEFSGDIKKALKTILHVTINPTDFFTERIKKACKGLGTDEDALTRVFVRRDEIDLKDIKKLYLEKYQITLYQEISDECSGDYKKILLQIAATD